MDAVQADAPAWFGRCVAVQGLLIGRRLYADRDAVLEPLSSYGANARRSLVLVSEGRPPPRQPPMRVRVTGVVGSCAAEHAAMAEQQAREPDAILMVRGYCHTSLSTFIRPVAQRVVNRRPVLRFTEAELPPERRPLIEAPATRPGLAEQRVAAGSFMAALAARDFAAAAAMTDPELAERPPAPLPQWWQDRQREARKALAALRGPDGAFAKAAAMLGQPPRMFVERAELETDHRGVSRRVPLTACWCRSADCRGRWPVTVADADNARDRPYRCVRLHDYLLGAGRGSAIQVEAAVETGGLAEPDWGDRRPAG